MNVLNNVRRAAIRAAAIALAALAGVPSFADDSIGVVGVDAGTNGVVELEMPFAPLAGNGPAAFLSGAFSGDGGEFSDRLFRLDSATGASTNAVWCGSGWLDPSSGGESGLTASPGDTLFLLRSDSDPFGIYAFGRAPSASMSPSLPCFSSIAVDATNATVSLGVAAQGPYDLLSSESTNASASASGWLHLVRGATAGVWSDDVPAPGFVRRYLVSDASRDTDGDGLPDALEQRVYGTSPLLADTDGDGIPDGREVAWGCDPLVGGTSFPFCWFEGFERPSVVPGPVAGQNGWTTAGDVAAFVREGPSFEGGAALEIVPSEDSDGEVSHSVSADADELWLDLRFQGPLCGDFDPGEVEAVSFAVTARGLVATDGCAERTNASVRVEEDAWTRYTVRLDYRTRRCDIYVDGVLALDGLAMRGGAQRLSRMSFCKGGGLVDSVSLATERPLGLSSDGDQIPDEWEFAAFGTLGRDGAGDFDSDGLSDLAEFRAGTDPLSSDTDGDGMPDAWEASHGLDPLDSADASLDPDGDGLPSLLEFSLGGDPSVFGPDPRVALSGLRAEFRLAPDGIAEMPEFSALEPFALAVAGTVDYADGTWPADVELRGDAFACRLTGFVRVPASGTYTFFVTADDGVELFVDGRLVASDPLPHSARECSGSIALEAGWHSVELDYYEQAGLAVLSLEWSGPGLAKEPVPADALAHYPANVAPVVSLAVSEGPYVEGLGILLSATAADVDGTVRSVAFYDGEALLGVVQGGAATYAVQSPAPGRHRFRAVATDSEGEVSESAVVVVVEALPRGFASGLDVSYYQFASQLSALPNLAVLGPVAAGVADSIAFPASALAWEGAPESLTNCFAAVFSGALLVREEGVYTLSLSSDDGSRLYLDGSLVVDNDGDHMMSTLSVSLPLSAGLHGLRVEYYENTGEAGLELSWTRPDGVSEVVPKTSLFRSAGIADSDGDGMPDWWEEKYSLDPADPADAALDPDGDGLANLAEFRVGANPNSPDTDSDGMPDAWEAANGTVAFISDAFADPDSDGLVNVEEMRAGTNPVLADTDGDGCSDYLEARNTRGNPLVADIAWNEPVYVGAAASGASFVASTGTWRTDSDGVVYAAERAGSLTWNLEVPHGGADALAVSVGQHNFYSKATTFDLALYVDGLFVSRQVVSAPYGTRNDAFFFLPEIPSGAHEFRLVWHNWESNTFLAVYDLCFVNFAGPDADGDGIADWKNHRAAESSAIDDLPLESLVSPLCVEGRDLWRDVLEVEVAYPETNATFATVKTIGDGFYADIPLPESGTATISLRDRSLADSFNVAWKPLDVFAGEFATNALVIRTGDALKIAPFDGNESEVTVSVADGTNGWIAVTNWTESAATPYVFEESGTFLVTVAHAGLVYDDTAYALVDVVQSRFPKRNPAVLMDAEQSLDCPELSPRNLLEHDSELQLEAEVDGSGVTLSLLTHADRDLGLVSRLDEGGAISDAVQVSPVWADNGTYYRVAETYPDGSQLIEVSLLLGAIPDGTTVKLEIFVSGVTFDDGTRTKTLTAADFDADGHITLRFIKARGVTTSVCHSTKIFQDGKLIYTNR